MPLPNNPQDLREALDRVRQEPEWVLLWEHLLEARQGCLLRLAGCNSWNEFLEIRGEFNALNVVIDFGDMLLERLEQAQQEVLKDGRRRGREGGYSGRGNGEAT
jgi:hypothetical protein